MTDREKIKNVRKLLKDKVSKTENTSVKEKKNCTKTTLTLNTEYVN